MDTEKDFLKTFLGIPVAILALCMGWGFWAFLSNGAVIAFPFMLGYIYLVINLASFKKWAWQMFTTIIAVALFFQALDMFILKIKVNFFEWMSYFIFGASMIVMPVFGISALIRYIKKRIKDE